MKQLFTILLAFICLISCKEGVRTIEKPIFTVRNSGTLEVNKITMTDTATILHIEAFFIPNQWIRIDSLTYLQGNNVKYQVTGSEGIGLNEEFFMPESGEASFTLFFPPIDRNLKTIDFIESDCEGCFKTYGLDLTGKATYPDKVEGIPDEVINTKHDLSGSIPEAKLEIGTTRMNIHLLGYRKGIDSGKASLFGFRFFPYGRNEHETVIDENTGIATFEFEQYGTSTYSLRAAGQNISITTIPGETMDIYIDLQESGRQNSRYHKDIKEPKQAVFFMGGSLANINHAKQNIKDKKYILRIIEPNENSHKIADMNADEYINYIIDLYKDFSDSINDMGLSNLEKELYINENIVQLQYAIISGDQLIDAAYRMKNKISWEQRVIEGFTAPQFNDKHYASLKDFQVKGTDYIYSNMFNVYPAFYYKKIDPKLLSGEKEGFIHDLFKTYIAGGKVEEMTPLTDKEKAELESVKNPFYANVLASLEKKIQKQIEEAKSKTGFIICEVPKVSDDKLFDAIISNYKGKVLLVDFWATWCVPCLSALKQTEPLKDTELKKDNLVFVYITGETSPIAKWNTMIPDIKGEHYRLSDKQWRFVCDKFKIDGIPSYVLVDKNGKYELRNEFRNHETMKKTLIEECAK